MELRRKLSRRGDTSQERGATCLPRTFHFSHWLELNLILDYVCVWGGVDMYVVVVCVYTHMPKESRGMRHPRSWSYRLL